MNRQRFISSTDLPARFYLEPGQVWVARTEVGTEIILLGRHLRNGERVVIQMVDWNGGTVALKKQHDEDPNFTFITPIDFVLGNFVRWTS